MVKRTGPTNPILKTLIEDLKKKSIEKKSNFLKDIAEKLNKPRRHRIEVNIAHIERNTEKNDTIIIPGVVVGYGELTKPVTISAWKFSKPAKLKIEKIKGKTISIEELVDKNPRGTNVKIMC
jgi:large subunit ribosomal protein L18e